MIIIFPFIFGIFNKAFILTHTYMKMSTKHARLRILWTSSSFYKTACFFKLLSLIEHSLSATLPDQSSNPKIIARQRQLAPIKAARKLKMRVAHPPQLPTWTEYIQPRIFPEVSASLYKVVPVISPLRGLNV